MFIVQKITQCFDPTQDRICLSVQDSDGKVLLLWLTQRLANRLAGALSNWLEDDLKIQAAGQSVPSLHAWEQAAAQAQLKPGRPVEATVAKGEALLEAVDLARSLHGYTLTFKWRATGTAQLRLSGTELRQWLGILHRLFDTAEWPKHAWPQWFGALGDAPSAATCSLH